MEGAEAAVRRRVMVSFPVVPGATKPAECPPSGDITPLLTRWSEGDRAALDQVLPLVYDELCQVAARQLRRERNGHELDPADLVHTLFLQLVDQCHVHWRNRVQFFAMAARMIRRILVDHARTRLAAKRGGSTETISLSSLATDPPLPDTPIPDVLSVDRALERLAVRDAERARIVELRFFRGLSVEEAARATGRSTRTVKREWQQARTWLHRELQAGASGQGPPRARP
jgi:RNA polymerase sigma factor (TIGR02999 family)